eukprot:5234216-Ditylum_brightwellii.AAC.1
MVDDGAYVAEEISAGKARAVSDGSYMEEGSAAACVIEGPVFGKERIYATTLVPGQTNKHDVYRAELSGIYMMTQVVNSLCKLHNITEGKITLACDGLEAIRKSMSVNTSFSSLSSQFDLLSAIDKAIYESPISWHWRHMKGHQDNYIGPLDRWATLNVLCDSAAKGRRRYDIENPPLLQEEIDGEMWSIFTNAR